MTPAEMIAVIKAHGEGKKIECRIHGAATWSSTAAPSWNFGDYEYRVRRVPKSLYRIDSRKGNLVSIVTTPEEAAQWTAHSSDGYTSTEYKEVI